MIPVMGVDPGVRGGLAVLAADGSVLRVNAFSPKWTHCELVDILRTAMLDLFNHHGRVAYVERVNSMPHDGHVGAFTFGQINGLLRGGLLAHHVQVRDAYPMVWQARMGCLSRGDKNVTKRRAQELFPGLKITHSIADALLIARYGWECLCL